ARSISAAIAIGITNVAYAEESEQEEGLQKITITAQKHEQNVTEVGMTMNVFDGELIKDLGVVTAEDIAQFTPALAINQGGTGIPIYTIRGVGFQDITSSSASTVGIYFDEVSIPYTVMSRGALFDVQRVEVLKGPQGDLYGRNTTGGQINFISIKPSEDFEAGFTASYGSFSTFDLDGFVNGSLSEAVNARVAFKTTQSSEGWQRSLTRSGDELGEKNISSIRGLFDFELSDDASVLFNIHYTNDQSDNQAATPLNGEDIGLSEYGAPYVPLNQYILPTGAYYGETPPWYSIGDNRAADWTPGEWTNPISGDVSYLRPNRDNQLRGMSAKLEWDIDGILLTSITSHDKFERKEVTGQDGMAAIVDKSENNTDMTVFSQELRFSGQTDEMLWIAGAYYSNDESEELYNYFMADAVYGAGGVAFDVAPFSIHPILRLHTLYDTESTSKAVFGHVEYDVTDKMGLTFGLRYTEEERTWSGCTYDAGDGSLAAFLTAFSPATVATGGCGTLDDDPTSADFLSMQVYSTDLNVEKWMGKIGIDYAMSDDVLLYATLSNGFKSGGFNGNNSNTTSQLVPYKPEELTSLEAGLKATLIDNTMQLNASVFKYDYTDKQEKERVSTPVGMISGYKNVPESEITGAEMDIQWMPTDGLRISLGMAILDSEVIEWDPVVGREDGWGSELITEDKSGEPLPMTPDLSWNALVYYEWDLNDSYIMDVSFDVNYTDDMPDPVRVQSSVDSYIVSNTRIAIGDPTGQWRLMLWGRNIADEYYFTSGGGGVNGNYSRFVGMPRTYGLTLTYNY
ncbi:MAG: TonB-dependent receptor, partial [Gammaproteobacteria bacterium]|nr:TonB-dependent receptor [Gammaproteobacteria bacterium]